MRPLYPGPSSSVGDVDTRLGLGEGVRALLAHLEECQLPDMPGLSKFHTELAYLCAQLPRSSTLRW